MKIWMSSKAAWILDLGLATTRFLRLDECVCRVLILRNNKDSIKKFRIKCESDNCCSLFHVNTWVSTVIKRKVEHLELCVPFPDDELPLTLPSCTTLVTLKLLGLSIVSDLSCVQLPSLKLLHFEDVYFSSNGCVRSDWLSLGLNLNCVC